MLFLDKSNKIIVRAKEEHVKFIQCRIKKRLFNESCSDPNCQVCAHTAPKRTRSAAFIKLCNLLSNYSLLETIIEGDPDDLYKLSNILWGILVPGYSPAMYNQFESIRRIKALNRNKPQKAIYDKVSAAIKAFEDVFEYDGWFSGDKHLRYDAYKLATNLNRNTCTYCNRIYTHTMKGTGNSKIMRPQFDHWFSKSRHPALSLSFFNLVPSCSVCNSSIKRDLNFALHTHLHPYVNTDCHDKFSYNYSFDTSAKRYHVEINQKDPDIRIGRTYDDLKLREVFDTHYAELEELIKIKSAYSPKYIDRLINVFPKAHLSYKEVYRVAFGVEYEEKNFHKLPLSKFKKDILRELKLIK